MDSDVQDQRCEGSDFGTRSVSWSQSGTWFVLQCSGEEIIFFWKCKVVEKVGYRKV